MRLGHFPESRGLHALAWTPAEVVSLVQKLQYF